MLELDGAYDESNIFARVVRGEIPSAKVFETEAVLAIMDVFPQAEGHVLVLHKRSRARNILDVEPQALLELTDAVQKAARAVRAALKPEGLVVTQFSGAAAGQSIAHLHFHVIPRWADRPLGRHAEGMADPEQLKALAARIAAEVR